MKNKTFTTRRADVSFAYGRNQNIVRHQVKGLGTISQGVIVGLLVLIVGLIYVAQGTQATNYDYELSEIEDEIAELKEEFDKNGMQSESLFSILKENLAEDAKYQEDCDIAHMLDALFAK